MKFTHFDKNLEHVLQMNHNNEINKLMITKLCKE